MPPSTSGGVSNVTSRLNSDAPLIHPPEVAQPALEQIAVADDDLLAGDAADARRLEPDVLDRAGDLIDADRVADVERLVEHDRQRREQVAEDVLHRERDAMPPTPRPVTSGVTSDREDRREAR